MKRFARLLRKDLEASKLPILINSGIIIMWMAFLRYRLEMGWPIEAVIGLMAIPIGFLPLWFIWQSFQTLRSEWREDTAYTLLALPVQGWYLTLSKLTALLIEYTAIAAVFVGGAALIFLGPIQTHLGKLLDVIPLAWIVRNSFLIYLATIAIFAGFIVYVQLAFVVAKLVGRFQGLIMVWVFLLASWLVSKVGAILQPIFAWIPQVRLDRLFSLQDLPAAINSSPPKIYWDISTQVGSWLTLIALFVLSSWLLENYVEITD